MVKKLIKIVLLAVVTIALSIQPPAIAAELANGAQIFTVECAGCHPNGGNIIRWWKPLKKGVLKRNHLETREAIAAFVARGKNPMPAYRDRLTDKELEDVSAYVLQQAERGWK
jgi:cytochrome c6